MNTKTATAPKRDTQHHPELAVSQTPDTSHQQVAVLGPPRLPYPGKNIYDAFGLSPGGWKVLVEATFPSAKTADAVVMALAYCRERNLDIFKRPINIVPMWDSKKNAYVETIWPSIAELRTTAFRTGNYAGCDETEFGPLVRRTFQGRVRKGRDEYETKEVVTLEFPEWARITVYRLLGSHRCKFVGPKVLWLESYATIGKSDLPNEMWQERKEGQLEKCAEAGALRKAFPEELGNQYTAEEMTGRHVIYDDTDSSSRSTAPSGEPPSPDQVRRNAQQQPQPDDVIDVEAAEAEGLPIEDENHVPKQQAHPQQTAQGSQPDGFTPQEREWLREFEGALSRCNSYSAIGAVQKQEMAPRKKEASPTAWAKAQGLVDDAFRRIQREDMEAN